MKRGELWYFKKMINGQRFVVSTGFADRKSAERRASDIEHDIRAGVYGWKSTIPSFAEWWAIYKKTYTPMKSSRNRDANIVAHFLPHFGARRLDEITKSDMVRYLNFRRTQMTASPGHKHPRQISESTVRRERSGVEPGSGRTRDATDSTGLPPSSSRASCGLHPRRLRSPAGIDDGAEALDCRWRSSGAAPGRWTGTRRAATRVCAVVGVKRGWQMVDRWTDRLSAVDMWAYTHCETVVQYAITQ